MECPAFFPSFFCIMLQQGRHVAGLAAAALLRQSSSCRLPLSPGISSNMNSCSRDVRRREGPQGRVVSAQPTSVARSASHRRGSLALLAPKEGSMQHLAALMVQELGLRAGDVYCLEGDVGAGKSVFSRAFIRAAIGDPTLTVPSPTFLLQNIYDEASPPHPPFRPVPPT